MTALKWIEELERLSKAATPGPWAYEQHGDTSECGVGVILDDNNKQIAGENSDPTLFVVESIAPEVNSVTNAAYIVAACNAVPRLVEMVRYLSISASRHVVNTNGKLVEEITPADMIDRAYNDAKLYTDEASGKQ